jgi:hypothetical protein
MTKGTITIPHKYPNARILKKMEATTTIHVSMAASILVV